MQTKLRGPSAPNTNQIPVNKQFISKLAWDELDSMERTAAMELVRTIDELREQTRGGNLLFYLKEMRLGLVDAMKNELE